MGGGHVEMATAAGFWAAGLPVRLSPAATPTPHCAVVFHSSHSLTSEKARRVPGPIASGPCLVHPEIQKIFKIFCHIEFCGTCIKH